MEIIKILVLQNVHWRICEKQTNISTQSLTKLVKSNLAYTLHGQDIYTVTLDAGEQMQSVRTQQHLPNSKIYGAELVVVECNNNRQ